MLWRAPSERVRAATGWLVAALGLGALLARFVRLDLAPFILDEPAFVLTARAQLLAHDWVLASPLEGTQGWTYGPSIIWWDGAVQWLLGARPESCILGLCVLVTLAHVALAAAVARIYRGGPLLFGLAAALLAASPYQFFWSRLAWDPLVNVCVAGALMLLASEDVLRPWRALLLGLILGFGISSHLMIGPFVLALGAVLVLAHLKRAWRPHLPGLLLMAAAMVTVNLPYLHFLQLHPPHAMASRAAAFWPALGAELLQPIRTATLYGMEYFFDSEWPLFQTWFGAGMLKAFTLPALATLLCLTGFGLAVTLRTTGLPRRLAVLATVVWAGYAVFYASRGLPLHPHYTFPSYWVVVAGVAGALTWFRQRRGWQSSAIHLLVAGLCGFQLFFIWSWMRYVDERGGTRGIHYSIPVSLQRAALEEICNGPQHLLLSNETLLFPISLQVIAQSEPACAGKQIQVCTPGGCPAPGSPQLAGTPFLHLHYVANSARLAVNR